MKVVKETYIMYVCDIVIIKSNNNNKHRKTVLLFWIACHNVLDFFIIY